MPAKDIANSFVVSVNTVRNIAKRYKLPLLRVREVEDGPILTAAQTYTSIVQVSKVTHHSEKTVAEVLNKHNIKLSGARIKHYTDAQIIALLKQKIPHRKIADDLHICWQTVKKIAKTAGFSYNKGPKNTRAYYKIRNQNIIDDAKILSRNEIIKKYGVKTSYISYIVNKKR